MKKSIITSAMLALPALAGVVSAAASPVYPCPQKINLQQQYTRAGNVTVSVRTPESEGDAWSRIPQDKEGAYSISITPGKVEIRANDELGVHYAKQTISQLLQAVADAKNPHRDPFPDKTVQEVAMLGDLPLGEITDWPDLPFRGTVEGFYGAPWSKEARISQFQFYGRNKMNLYIYAPKDDPYHHGAGCYKPYPADKAAELADLVKEARNNHVRFVWAIHPANTIKWAQNAGRDDLERLCAKLQQMYELGVRDFGVFVDDASGEICNAKYQIALCDYLMEHFIRKHPDVHQGLIMCPTGYNKAWADPAYLKALGDGLEKSIYVMWTGDTVVHDISLDGQKWVNTLLKRPTFIWWNWPVTDYKRSRLCMGRTYGLGKEKEMLTEMSGFTSNPMEHAEASKVALFSIADYTWNIGGFDSDPSWREGIRRLYPQSHDAMQIFCDHNSYLLPNVHGHEREESVGTADSAKTLRNSPTQGEIATQALPALIAEFANMEQAAHTIASGSDTAQVYREIQPWVTQFELVGQAGKTLLSTLTQEPGQARTEAILKAARAMNTMRTVTRPDWTPGGVTRKRGVEVAMREMTPTLKATFDKLNLELYATLAGKTVKSLKPTFICQGGNANIDPGLLNDDDLKTYWISVIEQQPGMWYGYDFGETTDIKNIRLAMGGPKGNDYFEQGQLEISQDGTNWQPVGAPTGGTFVAMDFNDQPLRARMLRFRITRPHKPYWVGINEFSVNKPVEDTAISTIPGFENLSTARDRQMIGINRIMEVTTCNPGDTLELVFAEPAQSTCLEVNLGNKQIQNWATIEVLLEDGTTITPSFQQSKGGEILTCYGDKLPKQRIKAMTLTNTGTDKQEIKLNVFKSDIPPTDPDRSKKDLLDADFSTAYSCAQDVKLQLSVPAGTREAIIVGDAACTITQATPGETEGSIRHFTLPEGVTSVTLQAPAQPGKWIQEVIFK